MVLDNGRFITSELAKITQILDEHFRVALSANKIVLNAITDWIQNNKKLNQDDLAKVTSLEEKGDELKRAILKKLAAANSLMQREDLMRLVHYNDKQIDGAEIACYHLESIMGKWVPEGELKDKVIELAKLMMSIVKEQREAIRFLSINITESMKKADEICRIEKEIDITWRQIVGLLYPLDIPLEVILRFRDFINQLEELANFSEDAAIAIRGLSLTLNT
jgi:predicted phosphate transport protein (TIGR00153 family)